ncbi:MAG: UDP-N-acetylenolpyruvoylglucosamine reductase [Gemmatimonadaceae bacterium]|jgi:UDP-N-acetylmuramate dehydrogenase|nr:UDP-N-acetylenolpyruvoylglucosamine reductase [Gemmatimonadaceae bacterium]
MDESVNIEQDIPLAPFTSLRLGGPARYLARCTRVDDLRECLTWAVERSLPVHVLGGGSNTVFDDAGFEGLVIHVGLRGVDITIGGEGEATRVTAAAGEPWDALVARCIAEDLSGVECLSGIPGLVGATPIQNVGAYGQQVCESISEVRGLDRSSLTEVTFANADCAFAYRTSRFKTVDRDRVLITSVTYRLSRGCRPDIRYPELDRRLQADGLDLDALDPGRAASSAVREAVLGVRRSKSMVLDEEDPNARSAGSFFLNPTLSDGQLATVRQRCRERDVDPADLPVFPAEAGRHKISAAWLVERSGFVRGTRHGTAGVSEKHALALISHGDSAADLLALAADVAAAVEETFGVTLEREPVYVST